MWVRGGEQGDWEGLVTTVSWSGCYLGCCLSLPSWENLVWFLLWEHPQFQWGKEEKRRELLCQRLLLYVQDIF